MLRWVRHESASAFDVRAPEALETDRLRLRRPRAGDAPEIFARYAADPEVTRYLSWPRHRSLDDTRAFLSFSDAQWERWPAGPYLIFSRAGGALLGSTGLRFDAADRAEVGTVLAREAWGRGYATEALRAMVETASRLGVRHLHASVHAAHPASLRVLEKCGFEREATLCGGPLFPNLDPGEGTDVVPCVLRLGDA